MTPQDSLQSNQPTQPSSLAFGSSPDAQAGGMTPARQLIADIAPLTQLMSDIQTSHPELADALSQMSQILAEGVNQAISQMQVPPSGGMGIPAY